MTLRQWIYYLQFETWLDCFIYNNRYILWLRRNHRAVSKWILLLTSPYILLNWFFRLFYATTWGRWRVIQFLKKDQFCKFQYEVAIVAIAKKRDYI